MTSIFDVFTEPREGNTLRGSVTYRDTDNYGFGQGPVFGLQLVVDAWKIGGYYYGIGPVSAETEAEFKELFEFCLGRKVRVDPDGYLLEEGSTEVRQPPVTAQEFYGDKLDLGLGVHNGVHFMMLEPESAEFERRTAEIIVSWQIKKDRYDPGVDPNGFEYGTTGDFVLQVSDPRYLEHFEKSTNFETAFTGHLA